MNTVTKEASRIEDKIAKLNKESFALESLYKDIQGYELPSAESICWHNSSLCEFSFSYEFKKIEDAYALIDDWEEFTLPLSLVKGTFTGFRTEFNRGKIRDSDKVTPLARNYTVKIGTFGITFNFYANVNGHLIWVTISSAFRSGWEQYARIAYDSWKGKKRANSATWIESRHFGDRHTPDNKRPDYQVINWASGTHDGIGDKTLYWVE